MTTTFVEDEEHLLKRIMQWVFVAFLIYLLISAVGMIGSGFKGATKGVVFLCDKSIYGIGGWCSCDVTCSVIIYCYIHYSGTCGWGLAS